MITKVAVTAWKRLMPYLSEKSQATIANKVRKPLAEYNKGVAEGSDNIANKLGITIIGKDGKSQLADLATLRTGGAAFVPAGERSLRMMGLVDKIPGLRTISKKYTDKVLGKGSTNAINSEIENLQSNFAARHDSVPVAFIRRSRGTAKDEFLRNTYLRHELSEGKHFLSHYKVSPDGKIKTPIKGVDLARPATEAKSFIGKLLHPNGVTRGHVSLGVLRDELKDVMKSGYADLHTAHRGASQGFTGNKRFDGLTFDRYITGELGQLANAGKDDLLLNQYRYMYSPPKMLSNGNIKRNNKRILRNLDKMQRANNIKNPNNTPSSLRKTFDYVIPS